MVKNTLLNRGNKLMLLSLMFVAALFLVSCDKAKETMDDATKVVEETADKAGEVVSETADKAGEMAEDAADKVNETDENITDKATETSEDAANKVEETVSNKFMGVWTGKLDSRLTTLTITGEEGNEISGKIVINYKKPLNQDVKGTFNPETNTLEMADQLHSRYKGKYRGKVSEDGKTYSGTFTTLANKESYSFNLVKK